jgi:hypothetical protein
MNPNSASPDPASLRLLRAAGFIAVVAGAIGTIGLFLRASHRRPPLIVVLFTTWDLAPFAALWLAGVWAKRWSVRSRAILHGAMILVALGSLAIYVHDAARPRATQPAFVYVAVPMASWVVIAPVVGIAAFLSRRQARRGPDA